MRCIEIHQAFGLDHLRLTERPDPTPGPGQVRLRLHAASLNYRDLRMVQGTYNPKQPLPLIPGSDGAGVIDAIGPGVSGWTVGQRAMGCFAPNFLGGEPSQAKLQGTLGGPSDGSFAEMMIVPAHGIVASPEGWTDAACATLPCAAVTAWNAIVQEGRVKAGDVVLVQGTGGVALFALQFAARLGARVIVTSSSDEKLEKAKALGAWQGINYKRDAAWGKTAKQLTDGRGVDVVIEVGGAGTIEQSLAAVRIGGSVMIIGVLSGVSSQVALTQVLMRHVRLQGVFVGSRDTFETMLRGIAAGGITPIIDREFPLSDARTALEHMASGSHFGKIVLKSA